MTLYAFVFTVKYAKEYWVSKMYMRTNKFNTSQSSEIDIQSQRLALIVLNCASILLSNRIQSFLPHDAMHKHCLCRHAVSLCVCLSVCLSCLWIM